MGRWLRLLKNLNFVLHKILDECSSNPKDITGTPHTLVNCHIIRHWIKHFPQADNRIRSAIKLLRRRSPIMFIGYKKLWIVEHLFTTLRLLSRLPKNQFKHEWNQFNNSLLVILDHHWDWGNEIRFDGETWRAGTMETIFDQPINRWLSKQKTVVG